MAGRSAADIDDFLKQVDSVQSQIQGLLHGTISTDDVQIPGDLTPEERKEEAEQRAKIEALAVERKAAAVAAAEAEEREKWWLQYEMVFASKKPETTEGTGEDHPAEVASKRRDRLDYSYWDKWVPDDPVSAAERKAEEEAKTAKQNEEFEKLNPDFCGQFKTDLEQRQKNDAKRAARAEQIKKEGNTMFSVGDYADAIVQYKHALKLTPFNSSILTNIAQSYLKLNDWARAVEFCNRAIALDADNVKARFRRAVAHRATQAYQQAEEDLQHALHLEPDNQALKLELERTQLEHSEHDKEAMAAAAAAQSKQREGGRSAFAKFDALAAAVSDSTGTEVKSAEEMETLLRVAAGCVTSEANAVYFRTSGGLKGVCGHLVQAVAALREATKAPASAAPPFHHPQVLRCAVLALASCAQNAGNVQLMQQSGAMAAIVDLACETREFLQPVVVAAVSFIGLGVSQQPTIKTAVLGDKRLLASMERRLAALGGTLAGTVRITPEELDAAAHCAEVFQTIGLATGFVQTLSVIPTLLDTLLSIVSGSVRRARQLTAAGRAFTFTIMSSEVLQGVAGTLANVVHHPEVRSAFLSCTVDGGSPLVPLFEVTQVDVSRTGGVQNVQGSALACIANAAADDAGVLRPLVERGAIPQLLRLLGNDVPVVMVERAAAVLGRMSTVPEAVVILKGSIPALVQALREDRLAVPGVQDPLVRVLATILEAAELPEFLEAGGLEAFAQLLSALAPVVVTREKFAGNVAKVLILLSDPARIKQLLKLKIPDGLVEVLKLAKTTPVKKNAAIALARIARTPAGLEKVRELRGMEILIQLQKEIL